MGRLVTFWSRAALVPSPLCSESSVTQGISRRRIWNATGQSLNFAMKKCGKWESIDKTYTCCFEERIFIVMSYLKTEFTRAYYDLRKASQSEQAPNCCSMCPWFMESGWVRHRGACSCFLAMFQGWAKMPCRRCPARIESWYCTSFPAIIVVTESLPCFYMLLSVSAVLCFPFPWSYVQTAWISTGRLELLPLRETKA